MEWSGRTDQNKRILFPTLVCVEEDGRSNSNNLLYSEELDVGVKRVDFALAEIGTCSTKPTYKPTYAEIAKRTYSAVKKSTSSVLRESHSLKRIQ